MDSNVLDLLQGYEWEVPKAPLQLDNSDGRLIGIASDETQSIFIRARAAAVLVAVYPSDRVWALYSAGIKIGFESLLDKVSRPRTVDVICKTFMLDRTELLQGLLKRLLNKRVAHLCVGVAQCLGKIEFQNAKSTFGLSRAGIGDSWEFKAGQLVR
tara:strand:+ start:304 stop:771 length:468 start_codon:yes stop_codon:yes gene_type:complete